MSSTLMMSNMGGQGGQTIVAVDSAQIRLEFVWGKSCFKGKYPRWKPVGVTQLLVANGFTDEYLVHELSLIDAQVDAYYGSCMKCFAVLYILILILGLGAIGAQFGIPDYRDHVMDVIENKGFGSVGNILDDVILKFIFIIGGIVAIIIFMILMLIHRKCFSKMKYKKTMAEIKDYIYGFELQNKYQLVKWQVKHTIDGVQFDIIVTPLQRENQLLQKPAPEVAMSTVSI